MSTGDSCVGAGAAAVITAAGAPASGTLAQDEFVDRSSSSALALFPQGARIGCSGALARCSRECSALALRSISASFATAASACARSGGVRLCGLDVRIGSEASEGSTDLFMRFVAL
jgi:hypothetical protein